ncbi:hypothetical protein CRENBAI_007055 [Crenichthys baileyi]|uniref:Uncharacterized protein n=1 Tax=Crenichthys baileyi TaxID=28760 RepID=A0AAV9RZH0_9TELE
MDSGVSELLQKRGRAVPLPLGREVREIIGLYILLHKPPLAKQNSLSEDDTEHQPARHPPPPPFLPPSCCSGENASLSFTAACLQPCWRQGDKSNTRETFL